MKLNIKPENILITLVFVGYPLAAGLASILNFDNRTSSILIRIIELLVAIFIISNRFSYALDSKKKLFWLFWWTFWILYILRIIIDNFFSGLNNLTVYEYLLYSVGSVLIPSLALSFIKPSELNNKILDLLIYSFVIVLLINLYVIFRFIGDISTDLRLSSETINPITIGHLGVTLTILASWRLSETLINTLIKKILNIIYLVVGLSSIFISGSRSPILSMAIAILLFMFFKKISIKSIFFIISFLISAYLYSLNFNALNRRLEADAFFSDRSRELLFNESIKLIQNNFFLGAGIEPLGSYPHNLILESFLMFGILSGFSIIFIILFTLKSALKIYYYKRDKFWIVLIYFQFLTSAMFSGGLYGLIGFFSLSILVVSVAYYKNRY
jgi:hypothetical protein